MNKIDIRSEHDNVIAATDPECLNIYGGVCNLTNFVWNIKQHRHLNDCSLCR